MGMYSSSDGRQIVDEEEDMKKKTKAWINAILLLVTLIVNGMGAFGLINGLSQKEISDKYPTLITPAPSTFSIWSIIYVLLIMVVFVMIAKNREIYYSRAIDRISGLFWLTSVLNMVWIISFSFEWIGLSTLFIFALLITLLVIVNRIGAIDGSRRWLLPVAFGLYAGWLMIATVVNIAAWLVKIQWGRFGIAAEIWSMIILAVAIGLTLFVVMRVKNAVFPLPVAWAYFGIYNSLSASQMYGALQMVALAGTVVLAGLAAIQFIQNRYRVMPDHR